MADQMHTNSVVTLIPPPVEPGAAPTNISRAIQSSDALESPQIIDAETGGSGDCTVKNDCIQSDRPVSRAQQRSGKQQKHSHGQNRILCGKNAGTAVSAQYSAYHKSQTAADGQPGSQQQHGDIVPVIRKAAAAEQIEPGIVERRNGMEHAEPDRLSHRIILQKMGKDSTAPMRFNAECHHQHHFQQPQDSLKTGLVEGLLNQCPLPDANFLARSPG